MTTPPEKLHAAGPPAAPPGGRIVLAARWSAGRRQLAGIAVSSERPAADRLLVGKTPEAGLRLVPLLYSLCGMAQAAVAQAALGAAASGGRFEVDGAALAREAVAEHLWRLLVDWPHNLQKNPDRAAFAEWHRALAAGPLPAERLAALAALVRGPLAESVEGMAALLAGEDAVRPPLPGYLPPLDAEAIAEALGGADAAFARRPTWRGQPAETGALATVSGPDASLASRLRARAADLARRVKAPELPAPPVIGVPLAGGGGIAGCATARGLLFHRAVIENGAIRSYVVVAPTEWNFHPDSAWVGSLAGLSAETVEIAENALRRWVLALDPCVPARIEITKED